MFTSGDVETPICILSSGDVKTPIIIFITSGDAKTPICMLSSGDVKTPIWILTSFLPNIAKESKHVPVKLPLISKLHYITGEIYVSLISRQLCYNLFTIVVTLIFTQVSGPRGLQIVSSVYLNLDGT